MGWCRTVFIYEIRFKSAKENRIDFGKMHHAIRIEYQMLVYGEGMYLENDNTNQIFERPIILQ